MDYEFDSMVLQIIKDIISMNNVMPINKYSNEEGYNSLISHYSFPSYSIIDIYKRKDSIRRCKTALNFFIDYPIAFSYSENCINFLITQKSTISPKLADFYSRFILFNYLSWMQNYLRSGDDDDIYNLMKSLLIYPSVLNIDCFFTLYYIIIQKSPTTELETIFSLLNTVFTQITEIKPPNYSYSFLSSHFSILLENSQIESNNETFSKETENMANLILKIFEKEPSQITTQIADDFYNTIKSFLVEKFDLRVLSIFTVLSSFLPYQTKIETISEFPLKIIQYIEKQPQPYISLNFDKNDSKIKIKSDIFGLNPKLNFLSPSFKVNNDELKIAVFPQITFDNICDKTTISFLAFISKSIASKREESDNLFNAFFEKFKELIEKRKRDRFSINIFATYLIFCHINEYPKNNHNLTSLIFEYNIWSPNYSIFQDDLNLDDFKVINALRYFSLNLILNQETSTSFDNFFNEIHKNPIILIEGSERLQYLHFSFLIKIIIKEKFLLNKICYAIDSLIQKKEEFPMFSLFKLLSKLMKETEIIQFIFNDSLFLSFFFRFIFEIQLQKYILEEIKMFLIDGCEKIPHVFIESFSKLFNQIIQNFNKSEEFQRLTVNLIQSLFIVFEIKPQFSKQFSFIIFPFLNELGHLKHPTNEEEKSNAFQFFEVIINYFKYLNHSDIPKGAIEYINGLILSNNLVECDDNLFNLIKSKMAKNNIIVQKLLVRLLFYCFWNKRSDQIIDLFTNYCKFSTINSMQLHEIEMDSFIVNELKLVNSFQKDEIEKRLILLEQIFMVISSPTIVSNFLSFLENNINYAFSMKKIFLFNESIPFSFLLFNNVIENEFKDDSGTFSFAIWIYVESENDLLPIFKLNNGNETIIINESNLFVNDSIILEVPIKKWIFLTFSFGTSEINCSFNTENIGVCQLNDTKKHHLFKYKIGDAENINGKYGNFGLFPFLTNDQIIHLFKLGPRNLSFPYFTYYEYFTQNKISEFKSQTVFNFPQIFIQKNKIQFLLPLFGQLNENNYDMITFILRNCLLFDVTQEEYFSKVNGFVVILYSLISNNVKYLTYDFYLFFFDLYQNLTLTELKNNLIKVILINFQLWSRSSEFLKIVQHWKNVLYKLYNIHDQIQLTYLLDLMRIFLYYEPIETNIINSEPIVQFDKTKEIRTNIIEIMIQNYTELINEFGYALLMYHLIDCQDKQQIQDLLLFFENLSKNPSKSLISFMRNTEIYLTLHTLLVSNDLNIVMTTLSIISNFRKANLLIFFDFDEMMYIYLFQMINSQINPEILDKMIDLMSDEIPELFPFCCCFSIFHDKNNQDKNLFLKIFQSIQPSKKLVISPIWALWALYGSIIQNKEEIIFFLIQCITPDYFYLYVLIDRICELFNFDGFYWKSILISFIADYINNSINEGSLEPSEIENFIDLSFRYIFFRKCHRYHNPALIKLYNDICKETHETPEKYKNSPAYIKPNSESESLNELINFLNQKPYLLPPKKQQKIDDQPYEIMNKIINSCLYENQLIFGIRFNEKEEWLDQNISSKVKLIIEESSYKSQDEFKNSLIYFLNTNHLPSDFNIKNCNDSNIIKDPNYLFLSIRDYSHNVLEKAIKSLSYTPEALQIYGQKKLNSTKQTVLSNFEKKEETINYLINNIKEEDINESNHSSGKSSSNNNQSDSNNSVESKSLIVLPIIDSEEIKKIQKIELIGQGSQSVIYKVFYLNQYLALKEMKVCENKSDIFSNFQRFLREFDIANELNHPNVIKTQGLFFGDENNPPSILFELLSSNLKQAINDLSDVQRITIIYEISSALKEMHHFNMIHRDLKPENILLDDNKHVKVSDFGISCLLEVEAQVKSMTTGIGTLKFMAPEILIENKHYNEKVDVFSFGVVVFFILTKGKYPENTIADVVSGKKAPIPPTVNKVSTHLINWCWSLAADERPSFSQIIDYIKKNDFNLIDGIEKDIQQIKDFLFI